VLKQHSWRAPGDGEDSFLLQQTEAIAMYRSRPYLVYAGGTKCGQLVSEVVGRGSGESHEENLVRMTLIRFEKPGCAPD
jgi:hypothetical protein